MIKYSLPAERGLQVLIKKTWTGNTFAFNLHLVVENCNVKATYADKQIKDAYNIIIYTW